MQDIKNLDNRGIPGGFVASEVFARAAESQADAVGLRPRSLFVAHPIQDRTEEEITALADEAFPAICAMICANGPA